ncbi:glycosyltransferase family 4 protein [bacterium]|nr:glycosyltransferase family 4 protein [bacterium]
MSQRPSVLQLCAVDFTARRFLLPLMRAQREAGFDVELACAPGPDIAVIEKEGFVCHAIPFQRSYDLPAHIKAYRELAKLLRRRPFTVVHAHTPIASAIARPCARRNGVPVVIYTAHGFYFHENMRPIVRRAHVMLERWAQRYADWLFTQSAEDCETAIKEKIAPAGRAETIGNGVDTKRFFPDQFSKETLDEARRELGIRDGDYIIVMIGRLVREKGYFEFLEAMAAVRKTHSNARALIIGSALVSDHDDAAHGIRGHANELGLGDGAIFAGLRSDVPRLLALGDIFCLPSWREGMPRSIIEAMAAGLPVVATDIRGSREEVVHGETGLIVPVRNAEALASALTQLAADPEKARRMGEAGRRRAVDLYDEQRVIERQMVRLRALLKEKGIE